VDDLIKALQILRKYLKEDIRNPTFCEHDILTIVGINPDDVSPEDTAELDRLGFHISTEFGERAFASFRYGSA
jgi:hypothetical protein